MPVPAFLALAAAVSFAGAAIFLRRALAWTPPATAAQVSVTFTALFIWLVAAVTVPIRLVLAVEIVPFLVAGLAAPGLARLVYYVGLHRIGVARATSLMSAAPVFAVALATLFLGERPGPVALIGVAAVAIGGAVLAQRQRDERPWRRRDMVLPLLAAVGFAVRDTISRHGLLAYPHPMVAAAGATFASVVLMWGFALGGVTRTAWPAPAGLRFLALSGLCECLAYVTMWRALATTDVSIVSPLVSAQPLFTVTLAAMFLRDVERVTWRVVIAALLIVVGIALVVRA
jgi:drug/metabolite transporter (DMT)-like permease